MSRNLCQIRRATKADADAAVRVLRASITACVLDHENDAQCLEHWLSNKRPEIFATWLDNPESTYWVALWNEQLCGVAAAFYTGKVGLCYVDPAHERKGAASALLTALEGDLREHGVTRVQLESSATARGFYERMGYRSCGDPISFHGRMFAFPYAKALE